MKKALLLILLVASFVASGQNNVLSGYVYRKDKNNSPVPNIQVTADSAVPSVTNMEGAFSLTFRGKTAGYPADIFLGLNALNCEVIDHAMLHPLIPFDRNRYLRIDVCDKKKLREYKLAFAGFSEINISAAYQTQIDAAMRKEPRNNNEIRKLVNNETVAVMLSELYGRDFLAITGFDNDLNKKAVELYKNPQKKKELESLLSNEKIDGYYEELTARLERQKKSIEKEITRSHRSWSNSYLLKAKIYIEDGRVDSAGEFLSKAIERDSTNADAYILQAKYQLSFKNEPQKALQWLKRAELTAVNQSQLIDALLSAAYIFDNLSAFDSSDIYYQRLAPIIENISASDSTYRYKLALFYTNRGYYYKQRFGANNEAAENDYYNAVEIRRKIWRGKDSSILPDLANSLINLGNLKANNGEPNTGIALQHEALGLFERCKEPVRNQNAHRIAISYSNLATAYFLAQDYANANKTYPIAIRLFDTITTHRPYGHDMVYVDVLFSYATLLATEFLQYHDRAKERQLNSFLDKALWLIDRNPDDPIAREYLGRIRELQTKLDE